LGDNDLGGVVIVLLLSMLWPRLPLVLRLVLRLMLSHWMQRSLPMAPLLMVVRLLQNLYRTLNYIPVVHQVVVHQDLAW
jgi:hypothetical protein